MRRIKAGIAMLLENGIMDFIRNDRLPEQGRLLGEYLESDRAAVIAQAQRHFALCISDPIATFEDAVRAAELFKAENVDILIIVGLCWSGDKPMLKLLRDMNKPFIYWCYSPNTTLPQHMVMPDLYRRSGAVGALQNSAPLARMRKRYPIVFGTPGTPEVDRELGDLAAAYGVLFGMETLRIGQVCGRYEEMTGTYVDEFRLLSRFGITLVPITLKRLEAAAASLTEEDIRAHIAWLTEKCEAVEVSAAGLYDAARVSLAVQRVALEENLGVLAIQDYAEELHAAFLTRPNLWSPALTEHEVVVTAEADAIAGLNLWISRQLGATTPMYVEMFTFDQGKNSILFGHASMHDPALGGGNPMRLIPDAELSMLCPSEGAWLHFIGKDGPVVVSGLFGDEGNYRAVRFKGEARHAELLDIHPNVFVKVDVPLRELYKSLMRWGVNQHFSLSYDDIWTRWECFCDIADIPLLTLE